MVIRASLFSLIFAGFCVCLCHAQTGTNVAPSGSTLAVSPSLDQAQKELLAQEEMLLKQVGEVAPAALPDKPESKSPSTDAKEAAPIDTKGKEFDSEEPAIPPASKSLPASNKGVISTSKVSAKAASPLTTCDDQELTSAKAKIRKLTADLDEARNRLMISETEVERLAHLVDERNRGSARASSGSSAPRASLASNGMRVREPSEIQAKAESDMPIATVISEKAQLRTGPGKDNSPLMTVSQGTRLAIETRSGDWYRVISPTGARAWVSSDVIDFGDATRPDSAARGKGFSKDPEDAAFEAIARGAKK